MKLQYLAFIFLSIPACLFAGLEWENTQLKMPAEAGQEKIIGSFKFINSGDAPVTILATKSSCDCTVASLDKATYAPGESGELKAVFEVGDRKGPQRKTILVKTDDAEASPITMLVFETHIPEVISLQPKLLLWRSGNEATWKEATIKTDVENKVSLPEQLDSIEYEFTQIESKPGEYILKLRPISLDTRKQLQFPITVELPGGKKKVVKLHVLVR